VPEVGLVDYGSGNLRSVHKALQACGASVRLVENPSGLAGIDAMVVPGVGAFGDCARNLRATGLWDDVREWASSGRPYLGICLGYQLLFEGSEESPGAAGLGVLPGRVVRFRSDAGLKVPHMGWNRLEGCRGPLFDGAADPWFYFVHSYYPQPDGDELASSWCDYGGRFASSVSRGALHAVQFHPEKSQVGGLALLRRFVDTLGNGTAARD